MRRVQQNQLAKIRLRTWANKMRRGQAMVETCLAVVFVSLILFGFFQLSQMLTARILLDHAAARAARARAVGMNEFMCLKSARVAMIPVAGKRVWPDENEEAFDEASRVPIYLCTDNEAIARGVLEYERWGTMKVNVDALGGLASKVEGKIEMDLPRFFSIGENKDNPIRMEGANEIEAHFPLYMNDQGR